MTDTPAYREKGNAVRQDGPADATVRRSFQSLNSAAFCAKLQTCLKGSIGWLSSPGDIVLQLYTWSLLDVSYPAQ